MKEVSEVLNKVSDISKVVEVNEKKTKELLKNGAIPCITTGTKKRTYYYTLERLIAHAKRRIASKFHATAENVSVKEAFSTKEIDGSLFGPINNGCTVTTFTNQKGGVGKTTNTINIAVAMAKLGQRVLVVDMDSQAQSSRYFRKISYEGKSILNLFRMLMEKKKVTKEAVKEMIVSFGEVKYDGYTMDILPSEIRLARGMEMLRMMSGAPQRALDDILKTVKEDYDIILLDTAPCAGLALETSLYATDKVVLVTEADEFAIEGLEATIEEIRDLNENIEKHIEINSIFVNSYMKHQSIQVEQMDKIIDIAINLNLSHTDIYNVKSSPSIVRKSQSLQLAIIDFKEKPREMMSLVAPMFDFATTMIEKLESKRG